MLPSEQGQVQIEVDRKKWVEKRRWELVVCVVHVFVTSASTSPIARKAHGTNTQRWLSLRKETECLGHTGGLGNFLFYFHLCLLHSKSCEGALSLPIINTKKPNNTL